MHILRFHWDEAGWPHWASDSASPWHQLPRAAHPQGTYVALLGVPVNWAVMSFPFSGWNWNTEVKFKAENFRVSKMIPVPGCHADSATLQTFLAPSLCVTNSKTFFSYRAKKHKCFYVRKNYASFHIVQYEFYSLWIRHRFPFLPVLSVFSQVYSLVTQIGAAAGEIKLESLMTLFFKVLVKWGWGMQHTVDKNRWLGFDLAVPFLFLETWWFRCPKYYLM